MMKLSNPNERDTLRDYVADLYNPHYLGRAWIQGDMQDDDFPFDWVVDFFFDDTLYAEKPELYIGKSLADDQEVILMRRMTLALDTLLTACKGKELMDAEYLNLPEWPAVHEAAKALHALILANDAKMAGS